jgi:hypothetical protein
LIIDNKIEKVFGKTPVFAGIIFLVAGGIMLIAGAFVLGLATLFIAAFVIFTFWGVEMDIKTRRIKQYIKWFGFIKTGKWKSVDSYIGITLIPISTIESMASWSNRIISSKTTDYRIFLVNKAKKPAFIIKKCDTRENAQYSIEEFSLWLKMPVYSVKH